MYRELRYKNIKDLKARRVELRKNTTKTEVILWDKIRNRQVENMKFKRQYSVVGYVVDFYCPEIRLVIEIDGDSHFTEKGVEKDVVRTKLINSLKINILRFTNDEIYNNLENALEILRDRIILATSS
jgi:very-short-patch-repair endonuclease